MTSYATREEALRAAAAAGEPGACVFEWGGNLGLGAPSWFVAGWPPNGNFSIIIATMLTVCHPSAVARVEG